MKKDHPDFSQVAPHQVAIHERLRNWARWVSVRPRAQTQPMFRMYRPAQHWHEKEHRETCDTLDAQFIEKVVGGLPPDHAFALRWFYVYRLSIADARRAINVSSSGLHRYLRDGRQMVINLVD